MATRYLRKLIALLTAVLTASSSSAFAADVRPFIGSSGTYRAIVIEGKIERGDFDTFVRIVRENQGRVSGVFIFSSGGDFYEAMKIGGAMRALELSSQVPMRDATGRPSCDYGSSLPSPNDPKNCTCSSACFFVHIGGVHRGGTFLAVHRPFFDREGFARLSQDSASRAFSALQQTARQYMQAMGVPAHIQEDVLGTPSDRIRVLDETTIKTYFWLELPYRHEWTRSRCTRLSDAEKARMEVYSQRLLRPRNASEAELTVTERDDVRAIQARQREETQCAVAINQQSRNEAYERFFGAKPSDYASHIFSKWSEAPRYLGRRFYEIMSEERFEQEQLGTSTSLKRAATAGAPSIRLSDSRSNPRVVTWIALVTPNPSPEFSRQVVMALEGAWGARSGGDGITEWRWEKPGFSARLAHNPVSAEGPFLSLVIEQKGD